MMLGLIAALAATAPWDAPLTLHGIGNLRVGMPVAALRRMGARHDRNPLGDDVDCDYWRPRQWPGISLMVSGGRVVRIETEDRRYHTASGARVGMTVAEIRRIYGNAIQTGPHAYTGPDGLYLTYRARSEPYALIFETDSEGGRVINMRAGTWEAVQLVEGCS